MINGEKNTWMRSDIHVCVVEEEEEEEEKEKKVEEKKYI